MKKILPVRFLLIGMAQFSQAQTFDPFKVDFAIGGAIPSGTGSKGGVLFAIEPKYAVMDPISVGLRIEAAITARGAVASDGSSASTKVAASSSYVATGDYYFTKDYFRPFAGVGAGVYRLASADWDDNTGDQVSALSSSTKFGWLIRAGFEMGHFRLGVEYNLIGSSQQTVTDAYGNSLGTVTTKNSYLGIKCGFFIGGNRH